MMKGNIKPFNNTKEYVLVTKQEGAASILPALDARNLINLPESSSGSINYLLFRIPTIISEDYNYHFQIEFSDTDSFGNIRRYNTRYNSFLFKLFDGMQLIELSDSTGISSLFSDKQLQLDLTDLDKTYKYFRFHWSSDNGETYGDYDFGNIQGLNQVFDSSYNRTNKSISFTSNDSDEVKWSEGVATFTHNMNCIPLVFLYDENLEQVLYGIKLIDENSFSIDFKDSSVVTGTWKIVISYGVGF